MRLLSALLLLLVLLGAPSAVGQTFSESATLAALTCTPDAATLCLNNSRFRVTADWQTPEGITGHGQAVPLTSDTGYFWFFNSTNIEIVTKVLNACVDPFNAYNRTLNALLPSAAIALLTGPINPCQDSGSLNTIQLKIPDLQDAPTGVVGKPSLPPDYPKAESVYFYFLVDSNHDGKFGGGDDGYNLVWQSGIYLTRTERPDRTVYDLTTDLTSPNAELFRGIGTGGVSEGVFCVPLRLTATRLK